MDHWSPTGQNLEDVLLYRCFRNISEGAYTDVGAGNSSLPSVTLSFYRLGWKGVLIEASETNALDLRQSRPRDLVINCAAGTTESEALYYEFDGLGISTLHLENAKHFQAELGIEFSIKEVAIRRTSDLVFESGFSRFYFLKVDVEGFEYEVIKGIDFKRMRPKVIVIKTLDSYTKLRYGSLTNNYLNKSNYTFAYHDGLNDFFVANEHPSLLAHFDRPVWVLDGHFFITNTGK